MLKAALNRAWHAGHAATDDSWRTVRPFRRADGLRVRYLQRDEIERLLNACGPDFRRLARRPSDGGRYGELCRVKVGDFDPDTGMLHIRETKSDSRGMCPSTTTRWRSSARRRPVASAASC